MTPEHFPSAERPSGNRLPAISGKTPAQLLSEHTDDFSAASLSSSRKETRAVLLAQAAIRACEEQRGQIPGWDQHFILLSEITKQMIGELNLRGCSSVAQLQSELWKQLPSSRFKSFQEAFSTPDYCIVPTFSIERGRIRFDTYARDLSVAPCIVVPGRIPYTLLESLHLAPKLARDEKDAKFTDKLPYLASLQTSTALKVIFERIEPIKKGNLRIGIIRSHIPLGLAGTPLRFGGLLEDRGLPSSQLLGSLLVTRHVDQPLETKPHSSSGVARAPQLPKLAVSHFSSIRDAYRMTLHQAQQHDRELAQVSVTEQKLQILAKSLQRGWRKDTPPEQKQALEQWAITTTTEAVELVKAVTNRHKLKAQDYLLKSDGIHDSQGRKNPQAAVSRLVQVCQKLSTRLEEISSIDGWNRDDQLTLRRTITNCGEATSQLSEILLEQLVPAISRQLAVLGKNPLAGKRASEEEHASKIAAQTKNFLGQFFVGDVVESYSVQPYIPFGEKVSALWNDLHSAFLAGDKNKAQTVTARLVVVQRLLLLQEGLDALKEQFATGMVSVDQAIRTTEQLAKALIDHPLPFVDLEPSLLQVLTAASRRVDILATRLGSPADTLSGAQSDPHYSKEDETEQLKQAKAYLKELDPRAFLPLIPSSDQTSP